MVKVVGVKFSPAGKVYYFDPVNIYLKPNDNVIVKTARGMEYGQVVSKVQNIDEEEIPSPLKPILRKASKKDTETHEENLVKAKEALAICKKEIEKENLDMKLIKAEYTFNSTKIIFYFTADGRVDFRELVKKLAGIFKIRIELRQIGVRDEAKILGGFGCCGQELCCSKWLNDFEPVSIKMAKEQGLSLNPGKISGMCGRLLCCLQYEQCCYEDASSRLPKINDRVKTNDGEGTVERLNVLKETFLVKFNNDGDLSFKEYHLGDVSIIGKNTHKESKKNEYKDLDETSTEALEIAQAYQSKSKKENDKEQNADNKHNHHKVNKVNKANNRNNKPSNHHRNYHKKNNNKNKDRQNNNKSNS